MKLCTVTCLAALLTLATVTSNAQATMIITAGDVILPYSEDSQTGSFEVYIQSDEAVPPDLFDWQIKLELTEPGIIFLGGERSLAHPYVLDGVGTFFSVTKPEDLVADPYSFKAFDSGLFSSAPLDDGDGFVKIDFQAAAGLSPGTYDITILNSNETFLADTAGDFANVGFQAGSITIEDIPNPFIYQNSDNRFDVDGNGFVNPLDLLMVVRDINLNGFRLLPDETIGDPPPFIDVTGDNIVNPLDLVQIVSELNRIASGLPAMEASIAEGEAVVIVPEPSTIVLVLLGITGAAAIWPRTRRR